MGEQGKPIQKPPIGVMPELTYKQQRLHELSCAINNYIENGYLDEGRIVLIQQWCDELSRRLKEFKFE